MKVSKPRKRGKKNASLERKARIRDVEAGYDVGPAGPFMKSLRASHKGIRGFFPCPSSMFTKISCALFCMLLLFLTLSPLYLRRTSPASPPDVLSSASAFQEDAGLHCSDPSGPPSLVFHISNRTERVHNDEGMKNFENTPVSPFRPQNQFCSGCDLSSAIGEGILTIITVTHNPQPEMLETARFIQQQSLRAVEWLIVDAGSTLPSSLDILARIPMKDPRVSIVRIDKSRVGHARDFGISKVATPFYFFLDDDGFMELGALEKCLWMLQTHSTLDLCGVGVVGFEAKQYTTHQGIHNGPRILKEKSEVVAAMVRTSAVLSSGCRYSEGDDEGLEDWHFLLCLADLGHWGGSIPGLGFWYRSRPGKASQEQWKNLDYDELRSLKDSMQSRHPRLSSGYFPRPALEAPSRLQEVAMVAPFHNRLRGSGEAVLVIVPDLVYTEERRHVVDLVKALSLRGVPVTVISTSYALDGSLSVLQPHLLAYTHDVFMTPTFLALADVPSFVSYVIESRSIGKVVIAGAPFGYGIAPWLANKFSHLTFVDVVHSFPDPSDCRSGGCGEGPRAKSPVDNSLDVTIADNGDIHRQLLSSGRWAGSIQVVHSPMEELPVPNPTKRIAFRKERGISNDAIVVVFAAPFERSYRPLIAIDAFSKAVLSGKVKDVVLLMVGSGSLSSAVRESISRSAESSSGHSQVLLVEGVDENEVLQAGDIRLHPAYDFDRLAIVNGSALGLALVASEDCAATGWLRKGRDALLIPTRGTSREFLVEQFANALASLFIQPPYCLRLKDSIQARTHLMFATETEIERSAMFVLEAERVLHHREPLDSSLLHLVVHEERERTGELSDYYYILEGLRPPQRGPYGTFYQTACGEMGKRSALIDGLEHPVWCGKERNAFGSHDTEELQGLAIKQCHATCIRDHVKGTGYSFSSDGCFTTILQGESCE